MSLFIKSCQSNRTWVLVGLIAGSLAIFVNPAAFGQQRPAAQPRTVAGVDAVRLLMGRKQYAEAEKAAYSVLWSDIYQPETMGLLAQALEAQKRPDEAATWYTLMARAATESDLSKAEVAKFKTLADKRLAVLNKEWDQQKSAYEKTAAGRKFETPEKVDDRWMTQVSAGLKHLHGLYAWKLVGGRKDRPADWIMNAQGAIHRSGMKRIETLDGRSGILFSCFDTEAQPTDKKPLINRISATNVAGSRYLRIGTKGYNFPYGLKVTVGEKELFDKPIGDKQWSDLKVDLGESPAKGAQVVLTLYKPANQKPYEGAWFDYIGFFED